MCSLRSLHCYPQEFCYLAQISCHLRELRYGSYITDGYLAYSVFQFFNNGGRQCYIVRVTRSDAVTADVTVQNRAAAPVGGLTFSAKNQGAWPSVNSYSLTESERFGVPVPVWRRNFLGVVVFGMEFSLGSAPLWRAGTLVPESHLDSAGKVPF